MNEEFIVSGNNLVDRVRELLHEVNVTRVIVKDEGGITLLEIPATVDVVGVVLTPLLAVLGVVVALVTKGKIIVKRRDGKSLFWRFDNKQENAQKHKDNA